MALSCKGWRDQWGGHCHTATAELSGILCIRGWRPSFFLIWLCRKSRLGLCWSCSSVQYNYGFSKSKTRTWKDPVSGLSYRGHCKPTSERTAVPVCSIITLTLNAGWSVFVYHWYLFTSHMFAQWQIKMSRILSDRFSGTLRVRH